MPQSIPSALTREHVLKALADLEAGFPHSFGEPTRYELIYQGKRFAPKAVIGVACRHFLGQVYYDFSGGEAPGQANAVLRRMGFTVVPKGEAVEGEEPLGRRDWSEVEVALTVADYFDMLRKEMLGQSYSKTEHRNALRPLLDDRSDSSVEFKRQNISAVLVGLGLPYIEGYKPKGNFQGLLAQAVETYLAKEVTYLDELASSPTLAATAPSGPPPEDLEEVIVDPPERIIAPEPKKTWLTMRPRKIDFVERDAANRQLGKYGEEFVVEVERLRLRLLGRDDLARKVDRVSESVGDGLGFDILSYDEEDEEKRFLEVKTTGLGKYCPFYVTSTEVRCSEDLTKQFYLYRVFDFSRSPRLYILNGSLRETCTLEPTQFRAAF